MAFADFPEQTQGVTLLQRSLQRRRLGHAYLFSGGDLQQLESLARTLAKTLNCQQAAKSGGVATDCCDACESCRKIDAETHGDIHWVRQEVYVSPFRPQADWQRSARSWVAAYTLL